MWPRHINYAKTHGSDPPRQALFRANVNEVTDSGSVWAMTLFHEFTGSSFTWTEMPKRGEKSNTLMRTTQNILLFAERHLHELQSSAGIMLCYLHTISDTILQISFENLVCQT